MEFNFLNYKFIIFLVVIFNSSSNQKIQLFPDKSYYYEEKYFRILSNNYDTINPGNFLSKLEEGYGFKAKKDFGSLILLKDWSMYNFKLTKVIFRNNCAFNYSEGKCDAEIWLIHTKDNGYYPPGRRIFLKQNYFIIVVPFVKTNETNPANDNIFEFIKLEEFSKGQTKKNISPKKPIKLYQIIQNQPSYLFDGQINKIDTLFMVFTQYHFFNFEYYDYLGNSSENKFIINKKDDDKIFRNVKNPEDIKQRVTLMAYSKARFLKSIFKFFNLILFLF